MSKEFNQAQNGEENSTLSLGACRNVPFLVKLEARDHQLLKSIAQKEERSMQTTLRKLASSSIRKKAEKLNISHEPTST